jgi:predicted nucleic acid-binding protein
LFSSFIAAAIGPILLRGQPDRAVARRAAVLRAEHEALRLADAMSLATAIMTDAALLTLGKKLWQIGRRVQPSP